MRTYTIRIATWTGMALGFALLSAGGCGNDTGSADADGIHNGDDGDGLDDGTADTASDVVSGDTSADTGDDMSGDTSPDDTGSDTATIDTGGDAGGIPASWTACQHDADCVPAEIACCDHCNGGKLGAFHKDHVAEAKAALGPAPGSCAGATCTEMACGNAVAWCEAGVCAAGPDPAFGAGCAALDEAKCKLSPTCDPLYGRAPAPGCTDGTAASVYKGCTEAAPGCTLAETCATDPKTGALWVFPSGCIPKGYSVEQWATCCASGGSCSAGNPVVIGKFCLGDGKGGAVQADQPITITVWPKGCFSSSCTKVQQADCSVIVDSQGVLQLQATVCLENTATPGGACTADCSGGTFANCTAGGLAAGSYQARLGELTLSFEVPAKEGAQACAGAQF